MVKITEGKLVHHISVSPEETKNIVRNFRKLTDSEEGLNELAVKLGITAVELTQTAVLIITCGERNILVEKTSRIQESEAVESNLEYSENEIGQQLEELPCLMLPSRTTQNLKIETKPCQSFQESQLLETENPNQTEGADGVSLFNNFSQSSMLQPEIEQDAIPFSNQKNGHGHINEKATEWDSQIKKPSILLEDKD